MYACVSIYYTMPYQTSNDAKGYTHKSSLRKLQATQKGTFTELPRMPRILALPLSIYLSKYLSRQFTKPLLQGVYFLRNNDE